MISFKPRIFISSTFEENKTFRQCIENFLKSIGAEPILYEKNLTPSTLPKVYRESIKEADFVILVIRKNYGTPTNSGLSGIHEEYRIAMENNIPTHVYILKSDYKSGNRDEQIDEDIESVNKLIEEINKNGNSYFYYKSESELIRRIKETTFSIAKDVVEKISINHVFSRSEALRISLKSDYSNAFPIIYIMKDMFEKIEKYSIDYVKYDIISVYTEDILSNYKAYANFFINDSINNKFENLCASINEFVDYQTKESVYANTNVIKVEVRYLGKKQLSSLDHVERYGRIDYMKYQEMLNNIKESFEKFEEQAMIINLASETTDIYN